MTGFDRALYRGGGDKACQNFQKGRYAMKHDIDMACLRPPESVDDPPPQVFARGSENDAATAKLSSLLRHA